MNRLRQAGGKRRLVIGLLILLVICAVLLFWPTGDPDGGAYPTAVGSAPAGATPTVTEPTRGETSAAPVESEAPSEAASERLPRTRDYRALAVAAAKGIYTWDSRSSSYSDIYARVRSWWELLPDGSNPLSVLVREFEGTGVTAGTFATLAGQSARRTGTAGSPRCDFELAKVQEYPAPWEGLHVCTVAVKVVDESDAGSNAYEAPVTVMVNCPPAITAPSGRCAMVAFYATAERIVF